jgi:hypothetical protein
MQLVATEGGGCATLESGVLECWGNLDAYHQPASHPPTPMPLPFDGGYVLEGWLGATCVRQPGGAVYCFGREVPPAGLLAQYPTLTGDTRNLNTGPSYLCAVRNDGGVDCWGTGVSINDGVIPNAVPFPMMVTTPQRVSGFNAEDEVQLNLEVICARHGATLTCWGYNTGCLLGDQPTVRLPGFVEPQTHYDAGINAFVVHDRGVCVADSSGQVSCWGEQLGNDVLGFQYTSCAAVPIPGFAAPVTRLCTGGQYACALETTGQVECWGSDGMGLFGLMPDGGPVRDSNTPVPVSGLTGVSTLVCGQTHACALSTDGRVRCWGDNYFGALGVDDGGLTFSAVPLVVPL